MKAKETIQLGGLGIGPWGRNLLRDFSRVPGVDVVAVCSSGNQENLDFLKVAMGRNDFVVEREADHLFSRQDVDAVVIATPISTHFSLAAQALTAGKHVFLEKAPTQNPPDFERLVEIANREQRLMLVDNLLLRHPLYRHLQGVTQKEKAWQVNIKWAKFGSFKADIYQDLAYHDLYLLLSLLGENPSQLNVTREAIGSVASLPEAGQRFTNQVEFALDYPEGQRGYVSIDRTVPDQKFHDIEVKCSKARFLWSGSSLFTFDENGERILLKEDRTLPLPLICAEFVERIRRGEVVVPELEVTRNVLRIIDELKNHKETT